MANNAYLYSSDRPDDWEPREEHYYYSKWVIPLAWFFFWRPDDIRLVEVECYLGSRWQEVKLSTEKRGALAVFASRQPLLWGLVERRIGGEAIAEFVNKVESWPGRFLLMNPAEVFGGITGDDPTDAERLRRITALLGTSGGSGEVGLEAFWPYLGDVDARPELHVIGYTHR